MGLKYRAVENGHYKNEAVEQSYNEAIKVIKENMVENPLLEKFAFVLGEKLQEQEINWESLGKEYGTS